MKNVKIVLLAVCVLLAAQVANADFSNPETASIANPAPPGTVFPAGPGGLVGGIGGPKGFILGSAATVTFTVTDCCIVGDVYEFFVDGLFIGMTAPVPIGGAINSVGTFVVPLAAGPHTYDIWDITLSYIGVASPFGGVGVVPANLSPAGLTVSAAPIPAALPLFASGLLGLVILRRRQG